MISSTFPLPLVTSLSFLSIITLKDILGCDSAIFSTISHILDASVVSEFKKFFLTGTLSNSFSITKTVPSSQAAASGGPCWIPNLFHIYIHVPIFFAL